MATKLCYLKMAESCHKGHSDAIYYGLWVRSYNVMYYGRSQWKNKYPELFSIYLAPLDYKSRVFLILLAKEICNNK